MSDRDPGSASSGGAAVAGVGGATTGAIPASRRNPLLLVPPMPNGYLLGLASAALLDRQLCEELRIAVADLRDGDPAHPEVVDAVAALMVQVLGTSNSQYFRFELTAVYEDDEPRIRRLGPEVHVLVDEAVDDTRSTRKLTLLVPLALPVACRTSVGLAIVGKDRPAETGTGYVMPSYLIPTVTVEPVVSDKARDDGDEPENEFVALVAHALGPAFR